MKNLLYLTYLLAVAWCISLAAVLQARASHIQGGQLTYEALGNDRYKVSLTVFRDCGGDAFSTVKPSLVYRTTGCAGGTVVAMNLMGNPETGSPYCARIPGGPSQCGLGLLTNYEKGTFEATVTLPPAAEWVLSVSLFARPDVANINLGTGNLYYEARLNNLLPNGQRIQNTSAQYQALDIPIPFVCYQQERTVKFATTEPDGDSLVYSLASPLVGCNEPNTYKSYAAAGRFIDITLPGSPTCAASISGGTGRYSAAYPMPSFNVAGSCPLKTATPAFNFDASQGSFTFTPGYYTATVNSADNKYVVVGQVTEYRRATTSTGQRVYYKVGQVRRDMLVVVIDCGANQQPTPPVASGWPKSGVRIVEARDSTFVTAYTCNYTEVRFRFRDPNPGDILTVTHPELDPALPTVARPTYLPGDAATFELLGNGTSAPTGILRIQPDLAFLGQTYRIPVRIEDNACPIKGIQYRTIVLTIKQGNFAQVVPAPADAQVCAGASLTLTATPFRPDSVGASPARYGYQWEAAPGLPASQRQSPVVRVTPTATTRYRVRILGLDFREGTCSDTASVLVRVQQPLRISAAASPPLVCAGSTSSITASASRAGGDAQETFTYMWASPNSLSNPDLTTATINVRPTETTRYKLTITGSRATACGPDTASVLVRVAAPVTVGFRADSAGLPGRSIALPPLVFTFTNLSKENDRQPTTAARYRWSYQRLLTGQGQPAADAETFFSTSATVASQQFDRAGVYRIRLRAGISISNAAPCQETVAELNIRVPDSSIPNVFTPNGDGLNDVFVLSTEPTNSRLQVFNRWGRLVREFATYNNDWNGDAQPAGTYFYLLTDKYGATTKGWIELIR
jgi:gliding motility-associated-like protein